MGDPIGTAAERRIKRRLLEFLIGVVGLREDRHQAEDQRQFAIWALGIEHEAHGARTEPLHAHDLAVVEAVIGTPARLQRLPRENDIFDGDRPAVVEACLGP